MLNRTLLALAGAAAVLAVFAAPVAARPATSPVVDVQPFAAVGPDGGYVWVSVIAECSERWAVVEAVVSVTQPQAAGAEPFPLTCTGSLQVHHVRVAVDTGTFDLGPVLVRGSIVVKRGKTESAQESETIQPTPIVAVDIADPARLVPGGVEVDVSVACSPQTAGVESRLVVSRNQVVDVGTYTPFCDGAPHTLTVFVPSELGPGPAQVLTFAQVDFDGQLFYGIDDGTIAIVG